jgi:Domain of unknown function (DUF4349)
MRRIIGVAIAVLVVAGAIVGIMSSGRSDLGEKSGGGSASATSATDGASRASRGLAVGTPAKVPAEVAGAGGTTSAIGAPVPVPGGPALPTVPTRVIQHARVDLRIRGRVLDARLQAARDAATAVGGYVEQTEQSATGASMTIRVPAARYAEVLDGIEHLGRVTNRSERGDDVTANFTDLAARIRNLRAQEAVLQDLMRQARTIPDTITVQQQLSGVTEQIEQLTGQQQVLDGESSFATIAVGFRASGAPVASPADRSSFATATSDAVDVMVAVAGGIVIVLGAVVPFAVLALLGLAVWGAVRRRRPHLGPADA